MKIFYMLLTVLFMSWSCSENSTGNDNDVETNTFMSNNVKSATTYFNFATNSGDTVEPAEYDISFSTFPYTQFIGCQTMNIPEPVIMLGNGITAVRVDAATLDEVTDAPESGFVADSLEEVPFIGTTWLNQSFDVTNEVYAIKTCSDNYALVQFVEYVYTGPPFHQVEDVKMKIKFNSNGSGDFASTNSEDVVVPNAYTDKQYYSFLNGAANENVQYDIMMEGYSVWLNVSAKIKDLNTTDFESITSVSDLNWSVDKGPEYVTLSWYEYNTTTHALTPKDYVYIVHTSDGKYAAFEIKSYFDTMGNSGAFTIDWKYLN